MVICTREEREGMAPLFELAGPDLDPGYLSLRVAEYPAEQVIKAALEGMWLRFESLR